MKGNMARTMLGISFIAALCMSMASIAQAQGRGCSLALAAGTYANSMSGTVNGTPYAAVELLTADAAGNISGRQTSSWNGAIYYSTVSGTYTVNADCTGTVSFSRRDAETGTLLSTGTLAILLDDNMHEVRFLLTSVLAPTGQSLPVVMKGEGRKLFPSSGNQQ